ncbi:hypothetical protein Tco_0046555 [Tanacetum coccineum]
MPMVHLSQQFITEGAPEVTEASCLISTFYQDNSDSEFAKHCFELMLTVLETARQRRTVVFLNVFLTHVEPKDLQASLEHSSWIEAMQKEIHEWINMETSEEQSSVSGERMIVRKLGYDFRYKWNYFIPKTSFCMFETPRTLSDSCGCDPFFDYHIKVSNMVFKFLQTHVNHADFRKFFWNLNIDRRDFENLELV